jgi:hypothetical protein
MLTFTDLVGRFRPIPIVEFLFHEQKRHVPHLFSSSSSLIASLPFIIIVVSMSEYQIKKIGQK